MVSVFKMGAARRDISPVDSEPLGGFIARTSPAVGVAAPLYVRAVVLRHGDSACAISQADLLGFTSWQVIEVREFAATKLGLDRKNVLLSATHTHSAPATFPLRGGQVASYQYQRSVVAAMQDALHEADDLCAPAELAVGEFPIDFAINRREETPDGVVLGVAPDKPRPEGGYLARISTARQHVLLYSLACHPYILGAENLLASGDFPAAASNELEADESTLALFLNGCAGNIAPLAAFQGMDAVRSEGKRLAQAVRGAVSDLKLVELTKLDADHQIVHLPYAPLPTAEEIESIAAQQEHVVRPSEKEQATVQEQLSNAIQDWGNELCQVVQSRKALCPIHCEVQALQIGALTLLGISGEPFFEIGEQLRLSHTDLTVWPLGYTNAFWGYIPTREEIAGGGYEIEDSWKFLGVWKPDDSAAERVVSAAQQVLSRIA